MRKFKNITTTKAQSANLIDLRDEIEEGTKTLTPQQLQVKALADQAAKLKKQREQLVARQGLAKAQEKVRDANSLT